LSPAVGGLGLAFHLRANCPRKYVRYDWARMAVRHRSRAGCIRNLHNCDFEVIAFHRWQRPRQHHSVCGRLGFSALRIQRREHSAREPCDCQHSQSIKSYHSRFLHPNKAAFVRCPFHHRPLPRSTLGHGECWCVGMNAATTPSTIKITPLAKRVVAWKAMLDFATSASFPPRHPNSEFVKNPSTTKAIPNVSIWPLVEPALGSTNWG